MRSQTKRQVTESRPRGYTIPELCEIATKRGFRATPRMVLDWIEKGLLDRTTIDYRGRRGRRGLFPENQLQLFLTLLEHRHKTPRAKKIWGLLNIPVWVWLWWGDDYVPFRQVKRAMKTWAAVMSRGDTLRNALRVAREIAGKLGQPSSPKGGRPPVPIRKLARMIHLGQLDRDRLAEVLRVFPPLVKSRKATAPGKGQRMSPERVHTLIWARYEALTHLEEIDDHILYSARDFYKTTYPDFLLRTYGGISPDTYLQIAEESLNKACVDFATALGLMRSQAITIKPTLEGRISQVFHLPNQDLETW